MKLKAWMRENRYNDPVFAAKVAETMGEPCSRRAVENWRKGIAMPRPKAAAAIKLITGGAVTADDHLATFLERKAS